MTRKQDAIWAVFYGLITLILYILLFIYQDELVRYAKLTAQGDKAYFIIPLIVAFAFSLTHGAFTGHFWGAVGLKPKGK